MLSIWINSLLCVRIGIGVAGEPQQDAGDVYVMFLMGAVCDERLSSNMRRPLGSHSHKRRSVRLIARRTISAA